MSQTLNYGLAGNAAYGIYYKHSNRVPPIGLLAGGILGLAAALVGAVIYAYAIVFIPLIYANVLCVVLFGALLGYVPARLMRWGKVRSVPVVLASVVVIALAAYYFHWAAWVYALVQQSGRGTDLSLSDLLRDPALLGRVIVTINGEGTWAMSKNESAASGFILGVVWLVEAGIIFGMAIYVALLSQSELPYCERCDHWCPKGANLLRIAPANAFVLRKRMEQRDWAAVKQAGTPSEGSTQWVTLIHHACPTCGKLHTLSAKQFTIVADKRRGSRLQEKLVVKKILVSPEDVGELVGVKTPTKPGTPFA